jgi:hypothetical protein
MALTVPGATTLADLLEGLRPLIDPARLVTEIEVDGTPVDATDRNALAARRLRENEGVRIGTETPEEFAETRRREIAGHLGRIADTLRLVADGFRAGQAADANQVLALAAHELGLVLELDHRLAQLAGGTPGCGRVSATVERIGARLNEAERERRWDEVAQLLTDELLPALRA